MKLKVLIAISIFLYSCNEKEDLNPFVSGDLNLNNNYFIDLHWEDSSSTSKTEVNIKWNQWITNDSTEFIKYSIKDVTTENIKLIEDIDNVSDTSAIIEFPTGTYLRLCVVAKYENNQTENIYYQSSDSILFFTEPLSPVTNIYIDSSHEEYAITWNPSFDDIDNLIIYRSKTEETEEIPSLDINLSTGIPNEIWSIVYEGDGEDTTFTDTDILNNYKYFYCINIQIENQNDNTDEYIENYRYSLIKPAIDELTDPIEEHDFNLEVSENFNDYIKLNWNSYPHEDFYAYEIWRSDDAINYSYILEITNYEYSYFEDRNNIGSGKSWWYKIKAYNHFGNSIESEIVEGYANP